MAYAQFLDGGPLRLRHSEVESQRFHMPVGRIDAPFGLIPDAADVAALIDESDCELVILRFDSRACGLSGDLVRALPTRSIIYADTLLYYATEDTPPAQAPGPPMQLVHMEADSKPFQDCIAAVFAGYENHYAANPRTRGVDMAVAYGEWTRGLRPGAEVLALGIPGDDALRGCLLAERDGRVWEVVLAGIAPGFRGQGLYGALVRSFGAEMRRLESSWVISTQAWNIAPQRAWVRAGLRLDATLVTLHVQRRSMEEDGGY